MFQQLEYLCCRSITRRVMRGRNSFLIKDSNCELFSTGQVIV